MLTCYNLYNIIIVYLSSFTIHRGNTSRRNTFFTSVDQNVSRTSRFHLTISKGSPRSLCRYCAAGIVSFANFLRVKKLSCIRHRAASDCEIWKSCTLISALPTAHCPSICSILIIGCGLSPISSWRSVSSTSR